MCGRYNAIYLPMAIVFPQIVWPGSVLCDAILDTLFFVDVWIVMRTSFTERGAPL